MSAAMTAIAVLMKACGWGSSEGDEHTPLTHIFMVL